MNKKIIKRIIFIVLLAAMAFVFLGYKCGFFNNFFIRHNLADETIAPQSTEKTNYTPEPSPSKDETKTQALNKDIVSIVQSDKANAKDIQYEEIRIMVKEAITLAGGFDGLIKDNQVVVLKPNLVQMHVDSTGQLFDKEVNGPTTDWRVTKAVVEVVRQYNPHGKVYIMEGSTEDSTKKTMEYLNYTPEYIPGVDEFISIEDDSGKWQDFESPGLIKKSLPDGLLHKEYYLNKKYAECDVLISIPCLKTNSGSIVSGSIKNVSIGATPANIYGVSATNPGRTKMVSHKVIDGDLDKWIYDYYMLKPVNFVVMDGLQGFQNGPVPIGRKNVTSDRMNMRLIMAGRDSVAVDTVEALTIGWDPESITYLKYLSKSGMGIMDTSKITIVGKSIDEVRKDFNIRFTNLGGVRIQDKKPPKIKILNQSKLENKLHLSLNLDEKVTKVEVFVDDELQSIAFPPGCNNIEVDLSALSSKEHKIRLLAYDRFLNHSEADTINR